MLGNGGAPEGHTYWLVVDVATGDQLPPYVKFVDQDEAEQYHRQALGSDPRFALREIVTPQPVDPTEPRVW